MNLRFEFVRENGWPRLAWLADCRRDDPAIRVRHGAQVEVGPEMFCEAIWDGPFAAGGLDATDLVFGSGARLRDGSLRFVSSGSTVDRLHVLRRPAGVLVSNSLACLLAVGDVAVQAAGVDWFEYFQSIKDGIDAYQRRLPARDGAEIELVYFRNLRWDGRTLVDEDKPAPARDFGTFAAYRGFLAGAIARIAENMADPARGHRYEMLGTLSSGYDSTTVVTLCRAAGMRQAISSGQARGRGGADDGREIAERLGIDLVVFDRAAWREQALPEVPFLAANLRGGEVFLSAAGDLLRGRVLVTGFHGDKVWGKETKALGPDVVRGDMSGLSLCEYRLDMGFIQFPPAFMGVRQIADINRLSNAPELAPWDVPGDYSRPICRRIVEEAGVPREAFGVTKKMASVHFGQGESLLTERTRRDYYAWLRASAALWQRAGRQRPRVPSAALVALRRRYYLVVQWTRAVGRRLPPSARARLERAVGTLQYRLNQRINLKEHVFPWAISRMTQRYRSSGGSTRH